MRNLRKGIFFEHPLPFQRSRKNAECHPMIQPKIPLIDLQDQGKEDERHGKGKDEEGALRAFTAIKGSDTREKRRRQTVKCEEASDPERRQQLKGNVRRHIARLLPEIKPVIARADPEERIFEKDPPRLLPAVDPAARRLVEGRVEQPAEKDVEHRRKDDAKHEEDRQKDDGKDELLSRNPPGEPHTIDDNDRKGNADEPGCRSGHQKHCKAHQKIDEIFPEILTAGEEAGKLTEAGAALLDVGGNLKAGIPFCPPEGDAGTGMVATASLRPHTGNVSAGTSAFAMIVLDMKLTAYHREIDIVATPCGDPVAMIHCNNCCGDIDDWLSVFREAVTRCTGSEISDDALYEKILAAADNAGKDNGIVTFNYLSGESITEVQRGAPAVFRRGDRPFTLSSFVQSLLYSAVATLSIGMEVLRSENIRIDDIAAHGGFCKSPQGLRALSSALGAPVSAYDTAGEGGAWGMAALAAYAADGKSKVRSALNGGGF